MRELIRRVASVPRGLAFLDVGQLECVAITFDVHPDVVLEARAFLATPERRAALLADVRSLQAEHPEPWHHPRPPEPVHGPRTAAALVRAAEHHEYGVRFLLESPPETVAVIFHVHPNVVFRARKLFARWRARHEPDAGS
jgi:hypothetical protein